MSLLPVQVYGLEIPPGQDVLTPARQEIDVPDSVVSKQTLHWSQLLVSSLKHQIESPRYMNNALFHHIANKDLVPHNHGCH